MPLRAFTNLLVLQRVYWLSGYAVAVLSVAVAVLLTLAIRMLSR
jgi:hypothetical protein